MSTGRFIKTAFVFAVLALVGFTLTPAGKRLLGKKPMSDVTPSAEFRVAGASFSVRFPAGKRPTQLNLRAALIDPDRPDADEWLKAAEKYEIEIGTIQGWGMSTGDYFFAVRVHTPKPEFSDAAVKAWTETIDGPGTATLKVTNLPVLNETKANFRGRSGRLLLLDKPGKGRVLTVFFLDGTQTVFLLVGKNGSTLEADDVKAAGFFNSVTFDSN
jgi:hypothetical protein